MTRPHPAPPSAATTGDENTAWTPRCVARLGRECRDCVECLSRLPDGMTCGACLNFKKCATLGYTSSSANRFCDFYPSRARFPLAEAPTDAR